MSATDKRSIAAEASEYLERFPIRDWLPMPYDFSVGAIRDREREEFAQRRAGYCAIHPDYVRRFSLPSPGLVGRAWQHIQPALPDDRTFSEQEKPALVILVALFVTMGRDNGSISYNEVFDALCRAYSDHHVLSPASRARDMRPRTVRGARRDLLHHGINANALWDFLVNDWNQKRRRKNKRSESKKKRNGNKQSPARPDQQEEGRAFYRLERRKTGRAHYIDVRLRARADVDAFVRFLSHEGRELSGSRTGIRLCIIREPQENQPAAGPAPPADATPKPAVEAADASSEHPTRPEGAAPQDAPPPLPAPPRTADPPDLPKMPRRFCAEVAYNVVEIGEASRDLLRWQSQARLLFDVENFKIDYDKADELRAYLERELTDRYDIDPAQSNQPQRFGKREDEGGDRRHGRQERQFWSRREKSLYFRSIEQALIAGKTQGDERIAEMARKKLRGRRKEWRNRRKGFVKWLAKDGTAILDPATLTVEAVCQGAVAGWNWRLEVREKLAEYDRAARLVQTYRLVRQQVEYEQGLIPIRSDFVRVINRRYQPLHMWPTYVSAKALPEREVGSAQNLAESDDAHESTENEAETDANTNYRRRWFKGRSPDSDDACPLVGRDISSSQTQIVATLLGLEELEALTTSRNNEVSFKKWLAELAFKHHLEAPKEIEKAKEKKKEHHRQRARRRRAALRRVAAAHARPIAVKRQALTPSTKDRKSRRPDARRKRGEHIFSLRVIATPRAGVKNYTGPDDPQLQNLCKTIWMTACYGSELSKVHRLQKADPKSFGPGWTLKDAGTFLRLVNKQFPGMYRFLEMCRHIANKSFVDDETSGFTIADPSDGSEIRWNPVARKDVPLPNNDKKVWLSLPKSRKLKGDFPPGPYEVDEDRLRRMMAPCLVHTLDAHFSTLVMKKLVERGVTDFVGIHDCWLLPAKIKERRPASEQSQCTAQDQPAKAEERIRDADAVLKEVIDEAAEDWYRGLGGVYDALRAEVRGEAKFEELIDRAREKWQRRVQARDFPKFLSKRD